MPRGRPRKHTPPQPPPKQKPKPKVFWAPAPPEIEDEQAPPPQKVVEVKHKTEWSEIRPVDEPADDDVVFELDDEESEPEKPRRKLSEREELRKKLSKANVLPGSQLKLTIEKYAHGDVIDGAGGSYAEREHCTKYICSDEHITSEDYLDVARRYGAGLFRFTLRMNNLIVTAWDKRISPASISTPVIPGVTESIGVSNGEPAGQMPTLKDYMRGQREAIKEQLEMAKLLREAFGVGVGENGAAAAPLDPKVAALQLIAENPDVMEKIGKGIASTVLGSKVGGDSDPWAEVAMEAVKSGQAVEMLRAAIDSIFSGINGLFPGRNGAQAQPMPLPPPTVVQAPQAPQVMQQPQAQAQPVEQHAPAFDPNPAGMSMSPEDQALSLVIEHCRRNAPVKIAFNRLIGFADAIEEQFPQGSIYDYVELFGSMPTDDAIKFVNTMPGGERVTALPHCRQWTADLQKMIRESQVEEQPHESRSVVIPNARR